MSYQDLPVDMFFDRIAEMPDVEAIQEIDLRLSNIATERTEAGCRGERRGILSSDSELLRRERHLIVMRMDSRKWSKAVRAIFGQEGLEECLVWMEATGEPDVKQLPLKG